MSFPTPAEIMLHQNACHEAMALGKTQTGIESMKTFYKAFPHAARGGETFGFLSICWKEDYGLFMLCDRIGFVTLMHERDIAEFLLDFVRKESAAFGTIRELITGKPTPPKREPIVRTKKPKLQFSLEDLGL